MAVPGAAGRPGPADVPPGADVSADVPAHGRIVLVLTSPRCAAGLLTWAAWEALRRADEVLAADLDPLWADALTEAGVQVTDLGGHPVTERALHLVESALPGRLVTWFGSPDGDPGLTDTLSERLSRHAISASPPEVELVTGSYDVPGARLLDLVAVMDRLRSPGGCPWDAGQTHLSLLPYLLEETHEVIEAVEGGDRAHLREELGDLLLQVVFHARVAQEDTEDPFDVDDVAGGIVAKLVHRHPHVFGADGDDPAHDGQDGALTDPQDGLVAGDVPSAEGDDPPGEAAMADLERTWEHLKAQEKGRTGLFEGIPATLPALALAQKVLGRWEKAAPPDSPARPEALTAALAEDRVARLLVEAVELARSQGTDAESVLRATVRRVTAAHAPVAPPRPVGGDEDS